MTSALFWRRVAAYLLDLALLFVVLAPIGFVIQLALGRQPQTGREIWGVLLWNFSLPAWVYFIGADGSVGGATVGKRLLSIRVRTLSGTRVSWPRAVARTAVKLLPWELTHVSAFALAADGASFGYVQGVGLVLANLLILTYVACAAWTQGCRSVHDFAVSTLIDRPPQAT